MVYKTPHKRKLQIEQHELHKTSSVESGVPKGYSSCFTSGTCRVTNSVISHERGKEIAKKRTYPWSFVTQIFRNGKPSHGVDRKTFEAMTSTEPLGTIGSVAS
jgi:hypothetical protein